MYTYRAYGLMFSLEFPCPELLPAKGEPDVVVRYGDIPTSLKNPQVQGVLYEAQSNQFLLKLENVAYYLVQNGNEIVIAPHPEATADEVRLFLLGSCLGALLHQRGILVMHASAIQTDRGAVLFVGASGNGKSTLLGSLLQRGYPMMADDVTGIVLNEYGKPLVLPAYPQVKLWHDACQQLAQPIENLRAVRSQLEKYAVPTHHQFVDQPVPLYGVYVLRVHNRPDMLLECLEDSEKFEIFLGNTYRQRFLDGLNMRLPHFHLATVAANAAQVTRVTRPTHPFLLEELTSRLIEDLG
ncbi:hypothetical protein GS597_16365 [Synechococcales cyanobacterium C]|uniref:HPr kinase n=1 Tax=Petrachloros mirabilis ULC683 TaxID=2781853 RepID=A0A8K2A1F0_9CYAN|nr:hypothetical protein [Petrachloros mirabilis]NCJ08053.1 hypothetical protein [Petrachloros mirabilis ULC683]